MGVSIDIEFKFPDWATKLTNAMDELKLFTAAQIQTNRGMMFDAEGADNGKPKWAALKWRQGQILSNTGNLRKSWAPTPARGVPGTDGIVEFSGSNITVGTQVLYARMMNDGTKSLPGGVLRATNAKALKIPAPMGGSGYIFRKSVKIEPRPMDTWTDQDDEEISIAVANKISEILNR